MDDKARETFATTLREAARTVGTPLDDAQIAACTVYAAYLLTVNQHTNLTRITAPADVAVKHFADSLTVFRAAPDLLPGATVVDVGTGAGFPGVVLKIARPDLRLVLLDSLQKRLRFLREVGYLLEFTHVEYVHARAEDAARDPQYAASADLVTARAVAALPTLLGWCGPFVAPGGRFVAMKAGGVDAELPDAAPVARALGLRREADIALTLPALVGDDAPAERRLLVYRRR